MASTMDMSTLEAAQQLEEGEASAQQVGSLGYCSSEASSSVHGALARQDSCDSAQLVGSYMKFAKGTGVGRRASGSGLDSKS